ncbi:Syntaxin-binding protein 4 [Chelonia mydas]|uniref:Syntaxin-binding protein 4 n=1 Tax=Chelonia mydas TaxID=8469 RepID=M7CF92_CHEMY|nr:Syntaxin-binding protein 4 [Chelonia mydas]
MSRWLYRIKQTTVVSSANSSVPCSYSLESGIQCISIAKSSGLGLTISGGSNRPEGPMIYVQELMPEGDCYRDGRLRPGDQLIAINKDSLVGSTYEEARKILAKAKCRHEGNTEVAFIPGRGRLHPGLSVHNSIQSPPPKAMGNGLSSCRLKVHVRSPEVIVRGSSSVIEGACKLSSLCITPVVQLFPHEAQHYTVFPEARAPASPSGQRAASGSKPKVALDPHIRLKDGKLELVLQYLGLDVTEEKRKQLRQSLITDSQGTVAYGDFLQALRDLLQDEREEAGLDASSVLFTQHEVASLLDTSAFHSLTFDSVSCTDGEELEQLQLEMTDLRQEVQRLKSLLKEVESSKKSMEYELQRLNQGGILELKRRLSLADGQLRKSEVMRKRLEICNRKLLLFVQNVHRVLSTPSQLPDETRVNSRTEEDKTEANLDASLPSPDLLDLLISEAKELLEPILANTTKDDVQLKMVQKYQSPVRVYKYPFELVMALRMESGSKMKQARSSANDFAITYARTYASP